VGFALEAYLEKEWIAKKRKSQFYRNWAGGIGGEGCLAQLALMRSDR